MFFFSIGLLSIIGNVLIVVVIWKTREFRQSQYVLKSSIAVSDFIWAVVLCLNSAGNFNDYFISYIKECDPYPWLTYRNKNEGYFVEEFYCELSYLFGSVK